MACQLPGTQHHARKLLAGSNVWTLPFASADTAGISCRLASQSSQAVRFSDMHTACTNTVALSCRAVSILQELPDVLLVCQDLRLSPLNGPLRCMTMLGSAAMPSCALRSHPHIGTT